MSIPGSFIREIKYTLSRLNLTIPQSLENALKTIPRELFLEKKYIGKAYQNHPIPIPMGQTCSAPDIYAIMMSNEYLNVSEGHNVLEIGTGSGYGAALLGYSFPNNQITTVERIRELVEFAKNNLIKLKNYLIEIQDEYRVNNISILHDDGTRSLNYGTQFDRIVVTACGPHVPKALIDVLKPGGIIIIPLEQRFYQSLYKIEKKTNGEISRKKLIDVRFVRLIGEDGY